MKSKHLLILLLLILIITPPAKAIVLRGMVTDVPDGQTIVITTAGRPLVVVLKGVAAPDVKQEGADLARKHLSSLILNKDVEVDFDEFRTGQVVAKVYCGAMDVALQVIRDGAAWYDNTSGLGLTNLERRVYAEAEQTAHNEMRGIWQDGSPMPPWEWRRAQAAAKSTAQRRPTSTRAPAYGLRSEDILASGRAAGGRSVAKAGANGRNTLAATAKPTAKPLNSPGLDADLSPYLTQGRTSIVYFYADWCPACRQMTPSMDAINSGMPDTQVLFMNIADWGSPVTQRYGITSIPYLRIFDKGGNLVAEGQSARTWLSQNLGRR
jgi:endonuclease YncB( thermonuclease family)/thiol-disulfide isomerase/thioredoxin